MGTGTVVVDKRKWKIVAYNTGAIVDVKDMSMTIQELTELSNDLKLTAIDWYCQMDNEGAGI